jgi:NhaP-type Na+/H+ or K+/H+ antiporter
LVDVFWACFSGLGVGGALGVGTAWVTRRLATRGIYSEFTEDFLGLGLISLSYGLALLLHGYGFLAVFAAAFMFHRAEMRFRPFAEKSTDDTPADSASNGEDGGHMATVTLGFVETLERLGEVILLILLGGMLFTDSWQVGYVAAALLLIFVIRPVSVFLGMAGSEGAFVTKSMIGWFGVRGIGSLYYLMYAIQHGLDSRLAASLTSVVLITITLSILLHGITVTPLMSLYSRRNKA